MIVYNANRCNITETSNDYIYEEPYHSYYGEYIPPRKTHTFKEKLLYCHDRLVKQLQKPSVIDSIPKNIYFLKKIKCFNQWSGKNFIKQK